MSLAPGTRLGPYRIVAPIGAGGMGEVYRAHDERLERDVAIKVLPPEVASSPDALARFEREAKAVAALSDPRILAVHDVGSADGIAYLVTELLEGNPLRQELAGGALQWIKAVQWGAEIAGAVGAAHARGIVHRDLKPENIFITLDGRVKILDFGLARRHVETLANGPTARILTVEGTVMGTVSYMSPEQVRGDVAGPASDIFSLGVVIHEMLTGARPFDRDTTPETMTAILREEPKPFPGAAATPPDLEAVIKRCLEKKPEARFQSAQDLAFALRGAGSGAAPIASHTPVPGKAAMAMTIVTIVAIVAIGVAVLLYRRPDSTPSTRPVATSASAAHSIAVVPFAPPGSGDELAYLSDGMTDAVVDALSRIPTMRVMSRSATERYRGGVVDPRRVAADLHVDDVLSARMHKEGDRLLIDAELSTADGTRVWGNRYESDTATPQRAQESLIADLARHFGHSTSSQPLVRRTTDDPEAYRLYLRARYAWNKRDGQSVLRSIVLFNQAIETDPTFALAYSGLADAYAVVGTLASLPARDTFSKAKAAAVKAVEIDDSIAEAHTSLAYVKHYWDHDWAGAEEEYRRAIALNPNYASAHQWYSELLTSLGRHPEARREIDRAVEIDPLSPMIPAMKILTSYFARDYRDAIAVGQKCIADSPDFMPSQAYLGRAYTENGNGREAIDALARALPPPDNALRPIIDAWLAHAYARAGEIDKTRDTAGRLIKLGNRMNPYYLSYPLIDLGRRDEALAALEKASEDRVEQLVWLKVDPVLDPLRGEPRFQRVLAKAGFR